MVPHSLAILVVDDDADNVLTLKAIIADTFPQARVRGWGGLMAVLERRAGEIAAMSCR